MSEDFAFDRAFLLSPRTKGEGVAHLFLSLSNIFAIFSNLGLQFSNDLLYCILQQILK